jgi:hypothetical protein
MPSHFRILEERNREELKEKEESLANKEEEAKEEEK